jgi:hypothetical protein
MATGMQVIERLTPLTGLRPTTLDRQFRAQRLAGQLPAGQPGGGKVSAHFEAHHLVAVLLGLAGPTPSDAPEAATALRTMPYRGTDNPPQDVSPPLPTLEDQLAEWIRDNTAAYLNGKAATDACSALFRTMKLGLCLNPRQAIITFEPPPGDKQLTIVYAADPGPPLAMRRLTILSGELFIAAGELVADTIEQNAAIAAVQFLGDTQPAKAGSGFESARASPPKALAPLRDQPRANGTGRLAKLPVATRDDNEFQAAASPSSETNGRDEWPPPKMPMT